MHLTANSLFPTDNETTPAPPPEAVERARAMAEAKYGFVPNQIKVIMEHSPAAACTYMAAMDAAEHGELPDHEREVVILTVSRYNDCHYCTRTHAFLGRQAGLSEETITAIHCGRLPEDPRLRTLVQTTRLLLDKRGLLTEDELQNLYNRGVRRTELFEINALIGIKLFSNYVNHVAQTEVDEVVVEDPSIRSMWSILGTMDHGS
jgi:AhpD family alkylhydroperoxidase